MHGMLFLTTSSTIKNTSVLSVVCPSVCLQILLNLILIVMQLVYVIYIDYRILAFKNKSKVFTIPLPGTEKKNSIVVWFMEWKFVFSALQ